MINANGFLCVASDPAEMNARSRGFRDDFIGARDAPPVRSYVDRAIIGLANSISVFEARRKNGTFNDIVLASVSLNELVLYWQKVIDTLPPQRSRSAVSPRFGRPHRMGSTIPVSTAPLAWAPGTACRTGAR